MRGREVKVDGRGGGRGGGSGGIGGGAGGTIVSGLWKYCGSLVICRNICIILCLSKCYEYK